MNKKNNLRKFDYDIASIIKVCFRGEKAKESATFLCKRLVHEISGYSVYYLDIDHTLNEIAKIQPMVFMEVFLDQDNNFRHFTSQFKDSIGSPNPMVQIPDNDCIQWCEVDSNVRFPKLAAAITPFHRNTENKLLEWTDLAKKIVLKSPDPIIVLNEFMYSLRPMSWSGSRADIMQERLGLIAQLENHNNNQVQEWASKEKIKFEEEIHSERVREFKQERELNERFE